MFCLTHTLVCVPLAFVLAGLTTFCWCFLGGSALEVEEDGLVLLESPIPLLLPLHSVCVLQVLEDLFSE